MKHTTQGTYLAISAADRWLNCTPSARLEATFPRNESAFSSEGTYAHELAALLIRQFLKDGSSDLDLAMSHPWYSEEHHKEVIAGVLEYVDIVTTQIDLAPSEIHLVETKIDISKYVPERRCILDFASLAPAEINIYDLKFGRGVRVYVKDNSQLKYYALAALGLHQTLFPKKRKITINCHIVQPRMDHYEMATYTLGELTKWARSKRSKTKAALEGRGALKVGTWCQFCRAAPECQALKNSLDSFKGEDAELMSDATLVKLYKLIPILSPWLKKVKDHMRDKAAAGYKYEGLKLAVGRSRRVFVEPDDVIAFLRDQGYDDSDFLIIKLFGIGAAEKLLTDDFGLLDPFIEKQQGPPTLVPVDSSALSSAEMDFMI